MFSSAEILFLIFFIHRGVCTKTMLDTKVEKKINKFGYFAFSLHLTIVCLGKTFVSISILSFFVVISEKTS